MASTTSSTGLSISSSSQLTDVKTHLRQSSHALPQCVSLPTLPPTFVHSQSHRFKNATSYCGKIGRNVMAMAIGEAQAEVATAEVGEAPAEVEATELPEIVKTVQEAWDKVEDKYAVSSLAVSGAIALWAAGGVVSALDRLPLVPGVLEVVGIGYTGWFAYKNLVFKPKRDAFLQNIKALYKDIIGSS